MRSSRNGAAVWNDDVNPKQSRAWRPAGQGCCAKSFHVAFCVESFALEPISPTGQGRARRKTLEAKNLKGNDFTSRTAELKKQVIWR